MTRVKDPNQINMHLSNGHYMQGTVLGEEEQEVNEREGGEEEKSKEREKLSPLGRGVFDLSLKLVLKSPSQWCPCK